jgi:hypothetical protein
VQNIRAEFEKIPGDVKKLDSEWEWPNAAEHGIDWESAAEILKMSAYMASYGPFPSLIYTHDVEVLDENSRRIRVTPRRKPENPPAPRMTWRRARWFARTLQLTTDLDNWDRFWLNEMFVSHERYSDWFGRELDVGDLVELLAFRPWVNESTETIYREAIRTGQVRPLRFIGDILWEFVDAQRQYGAALGLGTVEQRDGSWPHESREAFLIPDDELSVQSISVRWHNRFLANLFKESMVKYGKGKSDG